MALIGLIIASIVNIFVASSTLYWLVTYAGVLIFVGLTAYDTQWIKKSAQRLEVQGVNSGAAVVRQVAISARCTSTWISSTCSCSSCTSSAAAIDGRRDLSG